MYAARPCILIVDDVPENLDVLGAVLESAYRVKTATSGRQALDIAAGATPPDLILLDVMMPMMDGYAVLAELRASPATRNIPVIFCTAMDAEQDEEKGLALGAVDYLAKPIRPGIVLARVKTQLELKRARDILRNQNTFLEAEVERRIAENQAIEAVSIHALARLAEARDQETGKHLLRTQEYVRTLAHALRDHPRFAPTLDDQSIDAIARSAPLHDIGKVGIPDHILHKPGKLTPEEFAIMQTHAEIGARAIAQAEADTERPVALFKFAKEIARSHHEHWDGNGYPDGLSGRAIPLAARLMALADVFDALSSRRVYKPRFDFEIAYRIIVDASGKQFDPDVVAAFMREFDTFLQIARSHMD